MIRFYNENYELIEDPIGYSIDSNGRVVYSDGEGLESIYLAYVYTFEVSILDSQLEDIYEGDILESPLGKRYMAFSRGYISYPRNNKSKEFSWGVFSEDINLTIIGTNIKSMFEDYPV